MTSTTRYGAILLLVFALAADYFTLSQDTVVTPDVPTAAPTNPQATARTPVARVSLIPAVSSLDGECASFVRTLSLFPLRDLSGEARSLLHQPTQDRVKRLADRFRDLRKQDGCDSLQATHPLASAHATFATACGKLKDPTEKFAPERVKDLFSCLDAIEDFRVASIQEEYRNIALEKITDPEAVEILLSGALRSQGGATPDQIYELTRHLARLLPNNKEAATQELQAAYLRFQATEGGDNDVQQALDQALERLDRLDSKSPRVAEARMGLMVKRKDVEGLRSLAEDWKNRRPDNDVGYVYLAAAHFLGSDRKAAIRELETFARLHPNNPRVLTSLEALTNAAPGATLDDVIVDKNRSLFPEQFESENETGEIGWMQAHSPASR